MTKDCTKCKETKDLDMFHNQKRAKDGKNCWCKACSRALTKKWVEKNRERVLEKERAWRSDNLERLREKSREFYKNNKEKSQCHQLVKAAIASGKLVKSPCGVCNEPKVDAHHDDYSKPLDVMWLCRKHHNQRHWDIKKAQEEDE